MVLEAAMFWSKGTNLSHNFPGRSWRSNYHLVRVETLTPLKSNLYTESKISVPWNNEWLECFISFLLCLISDHIVEAWNIYLFSETLYMISDSFIWSRFCLSFFLLFIYLGRVCSFYITLYPFWNKVMIQGTLKKNRGKIQLRKENEWEN